jgi:hypothetical protein
VGVAADAGLVNDLLVAVAHRDHFQAVSLLQGLDQVAHAGVVLLRERRQQGRLEGAGNFLHAPLGLALQCLRGELHAMHDQQAEHHGLDGQSAEREFVAQRQAAQPRLHRPAARSMICACNA